ncbi:hypothetical protein QZH36_10900 [Erwinia sp. BC051422]|uniref:hypothetical protein n=1 Tax=Erwinia wuhanensis TaxID=3045167 RepID=UPI00264AE120|nr:hypothetical protein [Erwinia sp. BC051422]MDN8541947.1 hypothetical protein [Erwinia sp. BC051422]
MERKRIYAVDSTVSVTHAGLIFDNKSIDLKSFFPQGFKGKVIINFEQVEHLNESFSAMKGDVLLISKDKIHSTVNFNLKTNDNKINNHYNEDFSISVLGEKYLLVFSSIDVPYIARGPVPESKKEYVESSKILNLYVIISGDHNVSFERNESQVFDAYGTLGFAILDVNEFDKFISPKISSNDLIEEFTTTEIANELFDEGLMILSWGHTPWVYYINSGNYEDIDSLIGVDTGYCGFYKFKPSSQMYSVIPGNELRDWNNCKNKRWPVIEINSSGDYVLLKIYVKNALSQSDSDYPIPTFYLKRFDEKIQDIEPLLQSSILDI